MRVFLVLSPNLTPACFKKPGHATYVHNRAGPVKFQRQNLYLFVESRIFGTAYR